MTVKEMLAGILALISGLSAALKDGNGAMAIAFAITFILIAILFTRLRECENKHRKYEESDLLSQAREKRLVVHVAELYEVAMLNKGKRKINLTPIADLLSGAADSAVEYDPKSPTAAERRGILARARAQAAEQASKMKP